MVRGVDTLCFRETGKRHIGRNRRPHVSAPRCNRCKTFSYAGIPLTFDLDRDLPWETQ
jgi:hypothetical protein